MAPPIVVGLTDPALDARDRGLVLLGELGCVACHQDATGHTWIDLRTGPDLTKVGSRVHAEYLPRFLADPHGVAPGTTMPDLLRDRSDQARAAAAVALATYLRSFSQRSFSQSASESRPQEADDAAAERGRGLFHEIGCVACHDKHDKRDAAGNVQPLPHSVPLGDLRAKWRAPGLREFLLAPQAQRPSMRMPDLHLSPGEALDLSSYLLIGNQAPGAAPRPGSSEGAAATGAGPIDPAQIATGRALFAEHRCASCHRLDDPQRPQPPMAQPLGKLDPTRGCITSGAGPWPHYDLTDGQRADLGVALRGLGPASSPDSPDSPERRIRRILATRNCTACHQRGDFGGVTPERNPFFASNEASLGQDGRLPPPLTGVGAKLQREWLVDAVAHGQSIRPYLRTRMPGFGAAVAAELADLLARVDHLPPAEITPLPKDDKQAEAITELGRELVGEKGMNCISCHAFAGEHVGTMAAVDLVDSTAARLRPEWFRHFLQAPSRFRPGTLMPQFFIDGVSARPQLGGGDPGRQLDAIWHYLTAGRNVRKPSGMRSPPIEIAVGDEAVILRRSVQNTGKRGISVGYPLGVNLTFDAETLGLDQIWWGRFVDAAGVWTGQGSGQARILGKELATLPKGPAFVELKEPCPQLPSGKWPTISRRELGHTFLGYDLDTKQRPVFRYVCSGVTITDAPVDLPGASAAGAAVRPILRRTLTFESATDKTLHFRAALAARIDDLGNGVVQIGPKLRLQVPPGSFEIRPSAEQRELRIAIPIRQGRAVLVIDYQWSEEPR